MSAWKNLHFRPPILKYKILGGYASKPVLIEELNSTAVPYVGYILLKRFRPNEYRICGRGIREFAVEDPTDIAWMEVPE